ncbi:FkbM family methyltransferase [Citromicrobium bathyomarinum]|uniref:FkbM family methyltransferase n=1 Tax=Citromicrobium bathyomarinum TaxID=72174 RepID=UPI00315B0B06
MATGRKDFVLSDYGVKLIPNWGDSTFQLYVIGGYGTFFSDFLATRTGDFAFIDIGANQGLYSILSARNPHCLGVAAFEPSSATADLMSRNAALNEVSNIGVHRVAIAAKEGTEQLTTFPGHSGKASLNPTKDGFSEPATEIIRTVSAKGIDASIPDAPTYIVKVDVEGLEEVVLREFLKTQAVRRTSHIFYEVDEDWVSSATLEEILRASGFTRFERVGKDPIHYDVLAVRE